MDIQKRQELETKLARKRTLLSGYIAARNKLEDDLDAIGIIARGGEGIIARGGDLETLRIYQGYISQLRSEVAQLELKLMEADNG